MIRLFIQATDRGILQGSLAGLCHRVNKLIDL